MLGETISHYRIIEQLGEGGMGTVYLAEDLTLGRRVAIKFLSSTAPQYRARFLREARAVSGLIHPNIAAVFDYGETADDKPYIVMEFIEGKPLSEKLQQGSLPLPEAVRVVSLIAAALGEAHHHGVVHRDVKPSNVVLTTRGQVKVVDFGLVKEIQEDQIAENLSEGSLGTQTRSDVIVGTPLYLSPEQAKGKKVDGRSDLFALGTVLYECITGQSAFTGASVIEIGAQILHVTPTLPSQLNSRIPAELDRITMKAMEKDVSARYQKAEELIADLQAVVPMLDADDSGITGRTTGTIKAPRTHSASALTTISETIRRPRLSLATFVLAILAVAVVSWFLFRWWKPAPYRPNQQAQEFYDQGNDALRKGSFLQASKAFEQAVNSDPNFPLAHARLAEALFELDYWDKARDEMLKALALVPNRSELARSDDLYLEAINSTVMRNFTGAIAAYQELVRLSPDDPKVHVDLGRAYEKNDEVKKALESHIAATQLTPQYPAAFLRVAIQYTEQVDLPTALTNLDKAQGLFEAAGNYEGQAEVAYQRGTLLDKFERSEEGRPHLMRALELAKASANQYQEVKTLLKLGNTFFRTNPEEARRLINQAIAIARTAGIDSQVKRGLVDLGNSYIVTSEFNEAEKYYRESLEMAQKQKDQRNAARALVAMGIALQRQTKPDEALSYFQKALPFYQPGGYRRELLQLYALLARAQYQKGEYEVARKGFEDHLKLADQLGDLAQAQGSRQDIAFTYASQGRYPEALPFFAESCALAKKLRDEKNEGLCLANQANSLVQLGRFQEAKSLLNEASVIAGKPKAAVNLVANLHLVSARLALGERVWEAAKTGSQQAIDLASTQLKGIGTEARYTRCLALMFSGETAEGLKACAEAVVRADETKNPLYQAESRLALAQVLLNLNDNTGALNNAIQARNTFSNMGRNDSEWIALQVAARASRGNRQAAREYSSQARSILSSLEQKWGSENYQTYVSRPDIQIYQMQLQELLAQKP